MSGAFLTFLSCGIRLFGGEKHLSKSSSLNCNVLVKFGVLQRCSSLDLCSQTPCRRTYFLERIWIHKRHCRERQNYIFENAGNPLILHLQRLVNSGLCMKLDVLHSRGHRAAFSPFSVRIWWQREYLTTWFVLLLTLGSSPLGDSQFRSDRNYSWWLHGSLLMVFSSAKPSGRAIPDAWRQFLLKLSSM